MPNPDQEAAEDAGLEAGDGAAAVELDDSDLKLVDS